MIATTLVWRVWLLWTPLNAQIATQMQAFWQTPGLVFVTATPCQLPTSLIVSCVTLPVEAAHSPVTRLNVQLVTGQLYSVTLLPALAYVPIVPFLALMHPIV